MDRAALWLALVTGIVLGLSAGAMLTEATVLVAYWRSLPAQEFLDWFGANEPRLHGFYAPLQIASTVLAIVTAGLFHFRRLAGRQLFSAAALLTLAVLGTFFLYFKEANTSFVAATIAVNDVAAELARWGAWQWLRTALGTAAFCTALLALRNSESQD